MHTYDYSFLKSFPLPENFPGLLASLRNMNWQVPSGLDKNISTEYSSQALLEMEDIDLQPYVHALEEISTRFAELSLPEFLHICERFLPAESLDDTTRQALTEALSAYESAIVSGIVPLLLIPCVTLDVLCADSHSAALALALAHWLLCRAGYPVCSSLLLEKKICTYRYFYHRALDRSSVHWEQNGNAYLYYMEMFLSLLYLCGKDLSLSPTPPQRKTKRAAIEAMVLQSDTPVSKAEICAALPEVSPTTVEAALGAMVRAGSIQKIGAARAARYIRA